MISQICRRSDYFFLCKHNCHRKGLARQSVLHDLIVVWYSESGRTLWVTVFKDDPTVSIDEIKRTTIALLDHLADVVPPIYPTTTDEPSAPAS